MTKKVKLKELVEKMNMEVVIRSSDFDEIEIENQNVNRPGLQLTGFMENFQYKRVQIIGDVERRYYTSLSSQERYERFRGIFSFPIPCLIFSHNMEITKDITDLANYYNKTILRTPIETTKVISKLNSIIEDYLAEEISIHAGLMDVYGSGVLIKGKSSVGKSETALDLIIRGHRLVADDVVEIRKIDDTLTGRSPANIRHFMEIRGMGILDIRRLYGVGSVKVESSIDLVIELEVWDDKKEYDRLGLDEDYEYIFDVKVPKITVPVKPGRNIAMIIEVATMNARQKMLGYNSAIALTTRLFNDINKDNKKPDYIED
ncbi:HPr(Ser) kinase/phosphatase [Peptoniphilaceae bacterium SGI.131]